MLKIQGIDVILHNADGTTETVQNVLVGEPTTASLPFGEGLVPAYTLAIPKGDTRIWENRIVSFFGQMFRTVGTVEQGIETNIPTAWHKKIRAEQLAISGNCTVYEKNTFRRHVFRDVFFCDMREIVPTRTGASKQGDAQIYVYSVSKSDGYIPKTGDYVVMHESLFEFDASSEKAASESLAEFRKEYPDYATVHQVERKFCGMLPDYEILAR